MQYDTGTLAGRRSLAKKLRLREDQVLEAVSEAGLAPYTTLTDADATDIARSLRQSSNASLLGIWQKCLAHAKRDAIRRCRRHADLVQSARLDIFGHKRPPFPINIEGAYDWLRRVLDKEFDSEDDGLPWEFTQWFFTGDDLRARPGVIYELSEPVEWLERLASVTRRQAMLYLLTNDIPVDPPPLTVKIVGRYGVPLRVVISAEDYVPGELVSFAYSQARRMATGRARARPGPNRERAPTPRSLAEVLLERAEGLDEPEEFTTDLLTNEIWREIAPGIDQPPTSVSSSIFRTVMTSRGRETMVTDEVTIEWDLNLSEMFEQNA